VVGGRSNNGTPGKDTTGDISTIDLVQHRRRHQEKKLRVLAVVMAK
jgi:hypothetical protein